MIYFDNVVKAYCKLTDKLCERLSWSKSKGTIVTYESKPALVYEQSASVNSLYRVVSEEELQNGISEGRYSPVI